MWRSKMVAAAFKARKRLSRRVPRRWSLHARLLSVVFLGVVVWRHGRLVGISPCGCCRQLQHQ